MENERAELEQKKLHILSQIRPLVRSIDLLTFVTRELQNEYMSLKKEYNKVDYALAELDNKIRKIPTGAHGKKIQLSLDQVREIARRLGVELES